MWLLVSAAAAVALTVDAPPSLAAIAQRVAEIDEQQFTRVLARAGLDYPDRAHVTLIPESDPLARQTPGWIVGRAFGISEVVIFPERVASYPYDSLETVVRHEIVHLALSARAGGRPLPRWFHEGVALSLESGWGVEEQLRLLVASVRDPAIADVTSLFESDARPDTELAYLLAAALVSDLQRRHGPALPGAIAGRVARGTTFARAFELETGETVDQATAHAWAAYRRWLNWLPAMTSASAVWTAILGLAIIAGFVRLRRRAQRRRAWEEDEGGEL